MFILAASFLHHALEILTIAEESTLKRHVCSIPWGSLNTKTESSTKIVQTLLNSELEDEIIVVLWHEVWKDSCCRHKNNWFRSLLRSSIIGHTETNRKQARSSSVLPVRLNAEHCQKMKKQSVTILHVEKDFVSSRKQKDKTFSNSSVFYTKFLGLTWKIYIFAPQWLWSS